MKTLQQLTNVEKARLLYQLFPAEIPAFIDSMKGMSEAIRDDEAEQRANWQLGGLFGFDFWLGLLTEAERKINQYGKKLHESKVFADQLFDGYLALYTVHCLTAYAPVRQLANRKFTVAIDLFFNP
jgi:hypothetical protein